MYIKKSQVEVKTKKPRPRDEDHDKYGQWILQISRKKISWKNP